MLHGFAGYFEAVLYDNIGLSIHPERKDFISKDMLSWFPYFIPIKVRRPSLLTMSLGIKGLMVMAGVRESTRIGTALPSQ